MPSELPERCDALQKNAALGRDLTNTPLHVCQCPNCFTSFATANGIECVPKCDLASCDEDTGVCNAAGGTGTADETPAPPLLLVASLSSPSFLLVLVCIPVLGHL